MSHYEAEVELDRVQGVCLEALDLLEEGEYDDGVHPVVVRVMVLLRSVRDGDNGGMSTQQEEPHDQV